MELPPNPTHQPAINPLLAKHYKRIATAGQWARVLGWAGAIVLPLTGLFTSTTHDPGPLFVYILALPFLFYLIYAGKYVQYMGGHYVKLFLILNGIVAIFGLGGVIPIATIIYSFMGVSSLSYIERAGASIPYNKQRSRLSLVEIIIFILVVLAGFTLLIVSFQTGGVNTDNATNHTSSSNSSTGSSAVSSPKTYTSAEHGFMINFPSIPSVEHKSEQAAGYTIPYTVYSTGNDSNAYLVSVYDYSGIPGSFDNRGGLEGAVNGMVQSTPGGQLLSSNFITFKGYDAISASMLLPSNGTNYTSYATGLIRDRKMYLIFTVGVSKTDADNFTNSFAFTQ